MMRESGWYTLIADECTDISNKEQFTICIRWVGEDLQVHEDFVGLYEMAEINADSLVGAIKIWQLPIPSSNRRCAAMY